MPFRSTRFLTFLCFSFCLTAMLQACSIVRSKPPDTEVINDRADSAIIRQSQKKFAERNPIIVTRIEALELTIRMATPAEVPEDNYQTALGSPAIGAGSLALGLVAPPMFASALVVGGVLLIPLGTHLYFSEKRTWDSINSMLCNTAFTRAVDNALKDRLNTAFIEKRLPKLKAELIIQTFGLVKSTSTRPYCLVASARLILSRDFRELRQEQLQITDFNKSEDAPPPQCAGLDRFAENGARLVQNTLDEYAKVLAAMATDRILKECEQ